MQQSTQVEANITAIGHTISNTLPGDVPAIGIGVHSGGVDGVCYARKAELNPG